METIVLDKRKLLFWLFGKKQENFGKNLCFYFIFFLILVVLRLVREGVALEDLQNLLLGALRESSGQGGGLTKGKVSLAVSPPLPPPLPTYG